MPYVVQAAGQAGVVLAKVNIDIADDAAAFYGITSMPTFKVINKAGEVIAQAVGGGKVNVDNMVAAAKAAM